MGFRDPHSNSDDGRDVIPRVQEDTPAPAPTPTATSLPSLTSAQKKLLVNGITKVRGLQDVGVVYVGGNTTDVLRQCNLPKGRRTWVLLSADQKKAAELKKLPKKAQSKSGFSFTGMLWEATSTFVACGSAVAGAASVIVGAGAVPATGGTSGALSVWGWTLMGVGAASCGYAVGRLGNSLFAPSNNRLLDSNKWVSAVTIGLDVIAGAGSIRAAPQIIKQLLAARKTGAGVLKKALQAKALNHGERKVISQYLARAMHGPLTKRQYRRLIRMGTVPKSLSSLKVTSMMRQQLLDAIGGVLTLLGSAMGGTLNRCVVTVVADRK